MSAPQDSAEFDGSALRAVFHYTAGPEMKCWLVVPHDSPTCRYWAAVRGKCFAFSAALKTTKNEGCCIANVEQALRLQNFIPKNTAYDPVYVIFKPKNCTPTSWKRWTGKWSKRTAGL